MRTLLLVLLLGGCLAVGSGAASRPAVTPLLSELPTEPTKRDAVLEQSAATAGPEQRKGMTRKERRAETAAATAAALIGSIFSTTSSVTLGAATLIEESDLTAPRAAPPRRLSATDDAQPDDAATSDPARANTRATSNADLIPWIKLH